MNLFSPTSEVATGVDYQVDETPLGTWRRFVHADGRTFAEFTSHGSLFGLPWIHYTRGICPATGRRKIACGVFAFGRLACGVVAFGHASFGLIAVGQLAIGILAGLGQACTGVIAIGQVALGVIFGLGQLATGYACIAQLGFGEYVLAQKGFGSHVIDMKGVDPDARQFFLSFFR